MLEDFEVVVLVGVCVVEFGEWVTRIYVNLLGFYTTAQTIDCSGANDAKMYE